MMAYGLAGLLAALALAGAAPAAATEPPAPPPTPEAAALKRIGTGTLRWWGLRIYDAALYAGSERAEPPAVFERPFALVMRYARGLRGSTIADSSADEIEKLGFGSREQREAWAQAMRRLFPDVAAGDRLAGVHQPGRGARFYHNDRPIGEVTDAEFSRAFFSIWLDPRSSAPELRAALLGGR